MAADFASLGASLADLQRALPDRLDDAKILLQGGRYSAAIASGLYASEIALKARACTCLDLKRLPKPFEIHDLRGLLILSGLSAALDATTSSKLSQNWSSILGTSRSLNGLRYGSVILTQQDATDFFDQLEDPNDGVLSWITSRP